MPFQSNKQRAACWAQYGRDTKAGIKPKWDCKKWEKETTQSRLPTYKYGSKGGKRGTRASSKRKPRSSKKKTSRRPRK